MKFFCAVMFAVAFFLSLTAGAAVVELVNGDRISGRITGRDDRNLYMNSTILGDIVLSLSSISKITDDSAVKGAALTAAPSAPPALHEGSQPAATPSGQDISKETRQQPSQRLSDRGKYHGKRYFIPASIDFIRKISSMYNLKSSLKFGLSYYNGKTDSKGDNVAMTVARVWLMHELKFDYMQDYAESTSSVGVKTVSRDKMNTEGRYRYNINKRTYLQSDTQYGYSRVNSIDHDYLQSFGYGRRLVQTKLWDVNVTPSISCQYQVIEGEDQDPSLAPTLYEEAEYRWTDSVKVRNEASAIFPITGNNSPTYHFLLSLKNKLIGNTFVSFDYLFDYDGSLKDRTNAMQQTLRASFGVDF
jgi:putative salt-induced outer membrane protein YdiY